MGSSIELLCLALLPIIVLATDYCSVCSDHTMCQFTTKSPACGANSESGVSPDEAKQIVDLHNAYRAKIANGQETRGKPGPQPPAGNMRALVWDEKLAQVAQRWADQCTFQHDQCRDDPRFQVGQNIYWSSGFSTVNWTRAVDAWYNEVKDFSAKDVNNFRLNPNTGHYTQIAWATTTHIGCARTSYGATYRPYGYRPQEFILAATPASNSTANGRVKRHDKHGFFGGAIFDPSGARGAITASSGVVTGSTKFLNGNWLSRPTGSNFPSSGNSDNNAQDNPGFFGGATFNPAGAQGAITASSGETSGSTGSLSGNRPSRPIGGNFLGNLNGGSSTQNNPGFFGGATFKPEGAQGAITATSGGMFDSTESLSDNRPSRPIGGNFFDNLNSGSSAQNNPGFFGGATFNPLGAQGAITATSLGVSGSTGSLSGNRPSRPIGGNFVNNLIGGSNTQNNPGFFGGATFNPSGAQGAITATSIGVSGSTGSLSGNRPSRPIGGNFVDNLKGGSNPGFFGGATFNPSGAQGAITATSIGVSGSTGSLSANRPSRPIGGNFLDNLMGGSSMQNNPGFFGGATFNPAGAQGAITATSGGMSGATGSSNGNQPSSPSGGHFPGNGNYPYHPNYQSGGNRPYYPAHPDFSEDYSGDYGINFGSYSQSDAHILMNMPTGSVQVDNEDSSHRQIRNELVPFHYDILSRDDILICNYGPSGNLQGETLYMVAEGCSQCPTGTTCSNGLCVAS